ncbi:hydroxymethylpyrimidine/phosphomethylpyrimidine kinase [Leptobacterium flavescens]|uniref:hydroxymethylpyrimidine kinase n=1 Tax=Leptobacterium flavescens TaxID=472055 RepID=A0A6P0ULS3_9FLAO|nr:hydroxymethylpyrimidine/phosphomethylpyrimidine kinase [Leptobacterium flavescens]NER14291.1 hydroxymethylpyrimidine/phosphomethylpyrimidine kinase [Leptobacterium flavescens]
MKPRPFVLSIAGFDPSGGAGLTADIKTFEAMKCYGLAVCSANTVQNDTEFLSCRWTDMETMRSQIDVLFDRFEIGFAKIGIVENWKVLGEIIDLLLKKNPEIRIVLDPVLRASTGYGFHNSDEEDLNSVLEKIYLITPNIEEIGQLYSKRGAEETVKEISTKTHLFLKGGHRDEDRGKDELFTTDGKKFVLNPKTKEAFAKHGSGCVLSSAITAQLALGFPLLKACYRGKRYTERVLSSNKTLLGYHI